MQQRPAMTRRSRFPIADAQNRLFRHSKNHHPNQAVSVAEHQRSEDCNGQVKPDTFLDSLPIKIPLKLQRGLIT
jgi:hypothetical protein